MKMTFRWYGQSDKIPLRHIRQIPGVEGIVSALHDVPVGAAWTAARMGQLQDDITSAGLRLNVVESIPVHEDIKLGKPSRDRYIDAYCASVEAVGAAGVPVVCYNFMPIFDWTRTDLAFALPDGSTTLTFEQDALSRIDLSRGTGDLPGWATAYDATALAELRGDWSLVDAEMLWENLGYFLERVIPVASSAGVNMAIHPDDPPWPIFGLPRIIVDAAALRRVLSLVDAPANGLTFCTGSLGSSASNDLPAMVDEFSSRGRIHFMHCRNVLRTADHDFREVPHPSRFGDVDMRAVLDALRVNGYAGPMRPDHGRMIWDEAGRPGYGLFDRALGAAYLQGVWEGLEVTT
jgi:mannonate dehydratase